MKINRATVPQYLITLDLEEAEFLYAYLEEALHTVKLGGMLSSFNNQGKFLDKLMAGLPDGL